MRFFVDEQQRVISVEGREFPFDLDCRDGSAELRLKEGAVRLRRLSWREKRTLARFARLGEDFLKDQFLRISLDNETVPLVDEAEREAVWTLARWLNGPGGDDFGLPLDEKLLAAVTLDLCRAMRLAPVDFDALEAGEVELLWRAALVDSAPPAKEEPESGARVIILPDPAPASDARKAEPEHKKAADAAPVEMDGPPPIQGQGGQGGANAEARDAARERHPAASQEGFLGQKTVAAPPRANPRADGSPRNRFRVLMGAGPASGSRPAAFFSSDAGGEKKASPASQESGGPGDEGATASTPAEQHGAAPTMREKITDHRSLLLEKEKTKWQGTKMLPPDGLGGLGSGKMPPQQAIAVMEPKQAPRRMPPPQRDERKELPSAPAAARTEECPVPCHPPFMERQASITVDDLIDELADRLEESAGAMGIDLE